MRSLKDRLREEEMADADDRPLQSRSDQRKAAQQAETALKEVARRLVEARPKVLARVPLDEELVEAVVAAQRIRSGAAKNRQVCRIRQMLRGLDLSPIEGALDPQREGQPRFSEECMQWSERLLAEGDTALDELADSRPEVDRQRLRQLLRSIRRKAVTPSARRRLQEAISLGLPPTPES